MEDRGQVGLEGTFSVCETWTMGNRWALPVCRDKIKIVNVLSKHVELWNYVFSYGYELY